MSRQGEVFVDGVRSPTLESGPEGAKEAAVFVHGNPGSTHDWARLVEAVGEHGRALTLDMPGFGEADKPETFPYTIDGYAAHLGGALEQLGVERAHLIMHDFGGPWGLRWAVDHPDAYASTTLIDTGVLYGYSWHVLAKIWRLRGVGELFFASTTRAAMRSALKRGQPRPLPDEAFELFYRANKDKGTQRAILRLYRASPADALESLGAPLRTLDRPTLVVWGKADPYIKVEYAEQQKQTFPDAEVVVLDESGHWPMWDAPDEVAAAVVPFLARQLGGAGPA
jgi:pimeloyl-ACP methyl ester carboxylesterase